MKIVNSYELRVKSNKSYVLHYIQNIFKSLNFKSINFLLLSAFLLFCFSPLSAQPLPPAYNPYEYAEEDIFLTSMEIREQYESEDCATASEFISRFYNAEATDDKEKQNVLRAISFFQCDASYTFFENIIWNSSEETERCQAIMFLARMMNPDYLSTILEYAKNRNLSIHEKAAVATALMIYGISDVQPFLVEKAVAILDEICYDAPADILATCILNYFNLGDSTAIRFFYAQLDKEEYTLYAACFLAQLGEHKQTFPIFAAALSSDDEYEVHTAIMGLAAINTEEATDLIISLPPEKNRVTARERLINFNPKDIKKGD
jgi:hypothetical protein